MSRFFYPFLYVRGIGIAHILKSSLYFLVWLLVYAVNAVYVVSRSSGSPLLLSPCANLMSGKLFRPFFFSFEVSPLFFFDHSFQPKSMLFKARSTPEEFRWWKSHNYSKSFGEKPDKRQAHGIYVWGRKGGEKRLWPLDYAERSVTR